MDPSTLLRAGGRQAFDGGRHGEGKRTKIIERRTTKLPSQLFLWAAAGSMVGSLALQLAGKEKKSMFVGQWAPTLLILGLYNKLVRVAGSE